MPRTSKDRLYRKRGGKTWYGWYYDRTNRRRRVCLKTRDREVARRRLRELERADAGAAGAAANRAPHSVSQAADHYLEHGTSGLSPATVSMYQQKLGHVVRLLGELDVNALTRDLVSEFIAARKKEKAHGNTIKKELVAIRRMLAHAKDRGILVAEPRSLVPVYKHRYIPKDRWLTRREFDRLIAHLLPHRQLWVILAVLTGGRSSEIESIRWEQLDLKRGLMLLPGTKTEKARRWNPIAPELLKILREHQEDSGPVARRWVSYNHALARACKRARIDRVTANDLRRTYGSWLVQDGVPLKVVARLMGHSSTVMVDRVYGHLAESQLEHAMARLSTSERPSRPVPVR